MPPFLALFLCIVFVAGLLWIDWKRSIGLSKVVWLPTLWMLYCSSRPVSFWFRGGQATEANVNLESGNALERNLLSIFIVVGILVILNRKLDWSNILRQNRSLWTLFLFMLVSVLWSEFMFVSFKRWIKTSGTVIMALVILSESNPRHALSSVLRRVVYILIPFSAMLVKYYPRLGVGYGQWSGGTYWLGCTLTKNTLGALCMVASFFLVWSIIRQWEKKESLLVKHQTKVDIIVLVIVLWLLRGPGGAYSATSITVLFLGLSTFIYLRRLKDLSTLWKSIFSFLIIGIIFIVLPKLLLDFSFISFFISALGRDPTLTGRTDLIWSVLVPLAWKNPIIGIGYGSFWIRPVEGFDFDMPINQAHNGYLDVFIELGIIGLLILGSNFITFINKATREFRVARDWASFRIGFLLVIMVHNMTETTFLRSTLLLWNVFVLLMVVHPVVTDSTPSEENVQN